MMKRFTSKGTANIAIQEGYASLRQDLANEIFISANYSDGLHLKDSILHFDSLENANLSFISAPEHITKHSSLQFFTSEDSALILKKQNFKLNLLTCPYNHPFALGSLVLELLPSGHCFGGALLHVISQKGSCLYAPRWQMSKISYAPKIKFKEADTLILGANFPLFPSNRISGLTNLKKELKALSSSLLPPVVFFDRSNDAITFLNLIFELGLDLALEIDRKLHGFCKAHTQSGLNLPFFKVRQEKGSGSMNKMLIASHEQMEKYLDQLGRDKWQISADACTKPRLHDSFPKLYTLYPSVLGDIEKFIQQVKPSKIYFFGSYAKSYEDYFKRHAKKVQSVGRQPALF